MKHTAWVRTLADAYEIVDCGEGSHSDEITSTLPHLGGYSRLGITAAEVNAVWDAADAEGEDGGPRLHWLAYQHGWCRVSVSKWQNEFGVSAADEAMARLGVRYLVGTGIASDVVRVDIDDKNAVPLQSVILCDRAIDRFIAGTPLRRLVPVNRAMAGQRLGTAITSFAEATPETVECCQNGPTP